LIFKSESMKKSKSITIAVLVLLLAVVSSCEGYTKSRGKFVSETPIDKNQQQHISKTKFDSLVDGSILLLKTKRIGAINDEQHVVIMMCLNTIPLAHTKQLEPRFQGGRYDELNSIAERKKYDEKIIRVYRSWQPNKGRGYYFPSLQMELGGTPAPYAWFDVEE